jgi:hypothetical protein
MYLKCNRGSVYKVRNGLADTNCLRDIGTRLLDCPCSIRANYKDNFWVITICNEQYNYEGTASSYSHPIQCHMPAEVTIQVEALSNSGFKLQEILSAIRQTINYTLLAQNIYNAQCKLRLMSLARRSPMKTLIATLNGGTYHFNYRTDAIGCIKTLTCLLV